MSFSDVIPLVKVINSVALILLSVAIHCWNDIKDAGDCLRVKECEEEFKTMILAHSVWSLCGNVLIITEADITPLIPR